MTESKVCTIYANALLGVKEIRIKSTPGQTSYDMVGIVLVSVIALAGWY